MSGSRASTRSLPAPSAETVRAIGVGRQKMASVARRRPGTAVQPPRPVSDAMGELAGGVRAARLGYDRGDPRFEKHRPHLLSTGAGADYYAGSEHDRLQLIETTRDVARQNPLVRAALDRLATQVVKDGFAVNPQTGDAALDEVLRREWDAVSNDPSRFDASGRHTIHDFARFAVTTPFTDGDAVVLKLAMTDAAGRWVGVAQFLEAHRLRTPDNAQTRRRRTELVHGVEVDRTGRAKRYWITKREVGPSEPVTYVREVAQHAAFERDGRPAVLHLADRDRSSSTRPLPLLSPVIRIADTLGDFEHATLIAALTHACVVVISEYDDGFDPNLNKGTTELGETYVDGLNRITEELAPGARLEGRIGERIRLEAPDVNAPNFREFTDQLAQQIGMVMSLPLMLLRMDASQTNFSGWRGAMNIARDEFGRQQRRIVRQMYDPLYLHWLRWAVRHNPRVVEAIDGSAVPPGELELARHTWAMPRWPYIEPLKDAQADKERLAGVLTSPRRAHMQMGQDFEEVASEWVSDYGFLIQRAIDESKRILRATGVGVPWETILRAWSPALIDTQEPGAASEGSGGRSGEQEGGAA